MIASLGWAMLFLTDTLEMWHAMVLLMIHGFAGVFWGPPRPAADPRHRRSGAAAERRSPERDRALSGPARRARRSAARCCSCSARPAGSCSTRCSTCRSCCGCGRRPTVRSSAAAGAAGRAPCAASRDDRRDDPRQSRPTEAIVSMIAARRRRLAVHRQRATRRRCRSLRTISAMAIPASPTARCSPPMRPAR